MEFIIDAIENGDYCSLVFFAVIVTFVGERMVASRSDMRIWGLRVAAIAFIGFALAHVVNAGNPTASDLVMASIVGALGAIVVLGPAWIVLSIMGFAAGYYHRAKTSAGSAAHLRRIAREKRIADERKRQDQIDWERHAPERALAQREADQRNEAENLKRESAQKRRVDARADCEMLYQLYAADISSRFPRAAFDEWVSKFMGDDQTPDEVERRAEQLRTVIVHHREQVKPTPKFATLQELATWYQSQKEQIDQLTIEDRVKRMLQVNLNNRNAELMSQFLGDE